MITVVDTVVVAHDFNVIQAPSNFFPADTKVWFKIQHQPVCASQRDGMSIGKFQVMRTGRILVIVTRYPDDRLGYTGQKALNTALVLHDRGIVGLFLYQSFQYSGSLIARLITSLCLS